MEMCQHCHQYYAYVICQMASKRIYFFHIVKDIIMNVRYWYSSSSPVICFMCWIWYSLPNTDYLITDLLFNNSKSISFIAIG